MSQLTTEPAREVSPEAQKIAAQDVRDAAEALNQAIHRAALCGVETEIDSTLRQTLSRSWLQVAVVTKVRV